MADRPRLRNPLVRVVMDDGAEWEVQTRNPDLLKFDETAPRHGWPKAEVAPMFWLTFIAWAALRREGVVALKWEEFKDRAWEVGTVEDGEDGTTVMDPTSRDLEAG